MGMTTPGNPILTTTVAQFEKLINWGRANSVWPFQFGLACCAIEMMATASARFDLARFGAEMMRASPRQSDLMIVAGRVAQKMGPVLRHLYDQMLEPKWVIAMGDCSSCGGVYNNYAVIQGVDKIVPVDVYVAGCPPTPDGLLHGFIKLQEKIAREHPLHLGAQGERTTA
jgi:NADH-quinone oxidoreductase subunit B